MTDTEPGRVRRVLTDLSSLVVAVYAMVLPACFGLGWLSQAGTPGLWASAVVTGVGFLMVGFGMVMLLMFEEDWWDDFREQNRASVVFAVLHLVAVPAAWLWGRSVGG